METAKKVQMVPPPADRLPSIMAAMKDSINLIPEGRRGVLVGVGNEVHGNIAIVTRIKNDIHIHMWIGKTWQGSLNYGVQSTWSF